MPIRQLTHKTTQGEPYHRRPEVETQIAATVHLPAAELVRRAAITDTDDPDSLRDETLVYHLREALWSEDQDRFDALWPVFEGRVHAYSISRFAKLDAQYALDAYDELVHTIARLLIKRGGPGDYFEVSFRQVLKTRAIDAYKSQTKNANRDTSNLRLVDDRDYDDNDASSRTAHAKAGGWDEEASARKLDGEKLLADLRDHFADDSRPLQAFILRHKQEWPIAPRETPGTIANYFEVSDRTIRYWLGKVEAVLGEWRKRDSK